MKLKPFILLLILVIYSYSVEMKDLNIAIIWNDETYSTNAPYGWQVGSTTKGEDTHAPEIGKAQLKCLLNAIDSTITIDSSYSLDTIGIPDELTDSTGISGSKITNVRYYKQSNSDLDISRIKKDFNGKIVNSIIYLNSGDISGSYEMYKLFQDVAEEGIGIMVIGSESATELNIADTAGVFAPIMGIQKDIQFKAFAGDVVTDFDFLDANNNSNWDVPDTVTFYVSYDDSWNENGAGIIEVSSGDTIYKVHYSISGNNMNFVDMNNTIIPDADILTKYGEWSIKAKAVSVISNDLYSPEMSKGVYNNHDVVLVGKSDGVYVAKASWGALLIANDSIIANRGQKIEGVVGQWNETDSVFEITEDFVIYCKNSENELLMDSIWVIKAGTKINGAVVDTIDQLIGGTYLSSYRAGGYKNLSIFFDDTSDIVYKSVFPRLAFEGINELKFKPWTKGGRIKADADIWAFNEKFKLESLGSMYTVANAFDSTTFYCDYLGKQVAGTAGSKQFRRPPEKLSEFDLSYDSLLIDSIGYDVNGKTYNSIATIQKKYQRTMILGFQPTYLESATLIRYLLSDGIKWVSSYKLNHSLPKPCIIPKDSAIVELNMDTIVIISDFSLSSTAVKMEGYKCICSITINSEEKSDTIVMSADDGTTEIDSFKISLSSLGFSSSSFNKGDEINIDVKFELLTSISWIHGNRNQTKLFFISDESNNQIIFKKSNSFVPIYLGGQKILINRIDLGSNKNIEVSLFNLNGRKIKTLFKGDSKNFFNTRISESNLSKGMYLLLIKGNVSEKKLKVLLK